MKKILRNQKLTMNLKSLNAETFETSKMMRTKTGKTKFLWMNPESTAFDADMKSRVATKP